MAHELPRKASSLQARPALSRLIRSRDKPAIWLNEKIMQEYRPRMKDLYYNPEKYDTYLEQLGITFPTIK